MSNTHLKHIGQSIKTVREYRKIPQDEVSRFIELPLSVYQRIEDGDYKGLSVSHLVKIGEFLNCAIDIKFQPLKQ